MPNIKFLLNLFEKNKQPKAVDRANQNSFINKTKIGLHFYKKCNKKDLDLFPNYDNNKVNIVEESHFPALFFAKAKSLHPTIWEQNQVIIDILKKESCLINLILLSI